MDFEPHWQGCIHGRRTIIDKKEFDMLKRKVYRLEEENCSLTRQLTTSARGEARLLEENRSLTEQLATSAREEARLTAQLAAFRQKETDLFDGSYNYTRENVVQLSQFISRYLECPPDHVDKNKIYQCVQNCYRDLETAWADNPKHYLMDMQMLLATCIASTWFTDRQRGIILKWNTRLN